MKRGDKVIYQKALGNNHFRDIPATIIRKKANGYLIEQHDGRHITVKAEELKSSPNTSTEPTTDR